MSVNLATQEAMVGGTQSEDVIDKVSKRSHLKNKLKTKRTKKQRGHGSIGRPLASSGP
jgi:hypothetical protein